MLFIRKSGRAVVGYVHLFSAPLADVDPGVLGLPPNRLRGDQRLTRYRFLNGTKNEGRKQRNLFSGLRSLIECCE